MRHQIGFFTLGVLAFLSPFAILAASSETPEQIGAPIIEETSPLNGPLSGGSSLIITGQNFTRSSQVWLGGFPCPVQSDWLSAGLASYTSIQCSTPKSDLGTYDLLVQTENGVAVKKRAFTYIPTLSLTPNFRLLSSESMGSYTVRGGTPPYQFSVVDGTAQIDDRGTLKAPAGAETGLIQVQDARGDLNFAHYRVAAPLRARPASIQMEVQAAAHIVPVGGEPPYQIQLLTGEGKFFPDLDLFVSGIHAGKASVSITDSLGSRVDVPVEILSPGKTVKLISAGDDFTCAVISGSVHCWGSNNKHQLGYPDSGNNSNLAIPVHSLQKGVESIAAGMHHVCVLVRGSVKCWGDNHYGQLGIDKIISSPEPIQPIGLESDVLAIAAGDTFTCAAVTKKVYCWGRNESGELGDGTTQNRWLPAAVLKIHGNITGLTAGASHACAIVDGKGYCWGMNQNGQLGSGNEVDQLTPILVPNFSQVQSMSAGRAHTCALGDGHLKCWGFNGLGNLGISQLESKNLPYEVALLGATSLDSRQYHSCALQDGKPYCWGYNYQGQVGDDTSVNRSIPVAVKNFNGHARQIATGKAHTCALMDSDQVYCWGENLYGQLGNGDNAKQTTPVLVKIRKRQKIRSF